MAITPEQETIMKRLLNAADVLEAIARNADHLDLPILARECDYVANELRLKVGLQKRALESPLFE